MHSNQAQKYYCRVLHHVVSHTINSINEHNDDLEEDQKLHGFAAEVVLPEGVVVGDERDKDVDDGSKEEKGRGVDVLGEEEPSHGQIYLQHVPTSANLYLRTGNIRLPSQPKMYLNPSWSFRL